MFDIEKEKLMGRVRKGRVDMFDTATEDEVAAFEGKYQVTLPNDLKAFYKEINGFYDDHVWVEMYPLRKLKQLQEGKLRLGDFDINRDYFVIGEFGSSFVVWLLDMSGVNPRYLALRLGKIKVHAVEDSFKQLLKGILRSPDSMSGSD
jgi:hypothetical protein